MMLIAARQGSVRRASGFVLVAYAFLCRSRLSILTPIGRIGRFKSTWPFGSAGIRIEGRFLFRIGRMPLRISEKWGFGMAPPKPTTQRRRIASCVAVDAIIRSRTMPSPDESTLDAISDVKGLFNRVARQDQWDWFTVCGQLGYGCVT